MRTDFAPLLDKTRPLFLRTLRLPPTLRAIVLAPHPDDFDAIGITMRTLRDNGNRIDVVVLTSGASGVDDDFVAQLTIQDKAVLREQEQSASCQFFGLPPEQLTFLRLAEDAAGHLEVSEQNLTRLRTYWDAHLPDLVFLPHGHDTNAGHQRTYTLFHQVMETESRQVVALLNRDPKTIAMQPDVYTVFGEAEAVWKGALLRFHRTQHERNMRTRQYGIEERILRGNREMGQGLGQGEEYAEVFELEWYPGVSVRHT
jgi:LmbE family N-acetylglucosaminyl deacetylase